MVKVTMKGMDMVKKIRLERYGNDKRREKARGKEKNGRASILSWFKGKAT
jgi:hypothetical protein